MAKIKTAAKLEEENTITELAVDLKEDPGLKYHIICFRCGRIIRPGRTMISISVSLETEEADRSIHWIEGEAISTLCISCGFVLLAGAVIREDLVMPRKADDVLFECPDGSPTVGMGKREE